MFKRLERLVPNLQHQSSEVAELIPNATQMNTIRHHKMALEDFKSITLKLQSNKTTISESNTLFESQKTEYQDFDFKKFLSIDAKIIHCPMFE